MSIRVALKRKACKFAVLTSIAAFNLSGPASGQGIEFPIQGGNGGSEFKFVCPPGHFVVGIEGRAGAVVDHMQLRCAPFRVSGDPTDWTVDPNSIFNQGQIMGESQGGAVSKRSCGDSRFVKRIRFNTDFFEDKHLIQFVHLFCEHPRNGKQDFIFGFNPVGGDIADQTCDTRDWVIGFRGRRGSFVDAIGLVCARMPGL